MPRFYYAIALADEAAKVGTHALNIIGYLVILLRIIKVLISEHDSKYVRRSRPI